MKRMIFFLMILIFTNPLFAQKWMKQGTVYNFSENTIAWKLDANRIAYIIRPGLCYYDLETGVLKQNDYKIETLKNPIQGIYKFRYKSRYLFLSGEYYDMPFGIKRKTARVAFIPQGNHVQGVNKGDYIQFNNAHTATNAMRFVGADGIKEWLYLKNATAPDSFVYGYDFDATSVTFDSAGAAYFDYDGKDGIVIQPFDYWGANGVSRRAKFQKVIGGGKKAYVKLDTTGMSFPIIVDPYIKDTTALNAVYIDAGNATTNYKFQNKIQIDKESKNRNDQMRGLLKFDLSSVTGTTVDVFRESLFVETGKDVLVVDSTHYGLKFTPLNVAFVDEFATWTIRTTGTNWTNKGALDDTIASNLYNPTYPYSKINGENRWFVYANDSTSANKMTAYFEAVLGGIITNNGHVMMFDSAGYDSSGDPGSSQFARIIFTTFAANNPRLYIVAYTASPCSIAFGDSNAVSVYIDSLIGNFSSDVQISIFNNTFGKYYKVTGGSNLRAELTDTLHWSNETTWQGKALPMRSNSDNYFTIVTRTPSGVPIDTTIQHFQVGSPPLGLNFTGRDSLWFVMYDTTNRIYKWLPVDSLLNWEQPFYANQYYANSFSLLPQSILGRFNIWAWRREIN